MIQSPESEQVAWVKKLHKPYAFVRWKVRKQSHSPTFLQRRRKYDHIHFIRVVHSSGSCLHASQIYDSR